MGRTQASEFPENKVMAVQASQALLRVVVKRTSSAIVRGWMGKDQHGLLVPKQVIPESLPGMKEWCPGLNCSLPNDCEVTLAG